MLIRKPKTFAVEIITIEYNYQNIGSNPTIENEIIYSDDSSF